MTFAALILTVFMPGLGHILIGRYGRGLVLWVVYTSAVAGALACGLPGEHSALFVVFVALATMCWIYSVVNIVDATYGPGSSRSEECDQHFRQGVIHYLRGELVRARQELQRALTLNRRDIEARLHLAMVHAADGRFRRARRALKRCLALDHEGKWHWEIHQELRRLDQRILATPPARASREAVPPTRAEPVENPTPRES